LRRQRNNSKKIVDEPISAVNPEWDEEGVVAYAMKKCRSLSPYTARKLPSASRENPPVALLVTPMIRLGIPW